MNVTTSCCAGIFQTPPEWPAQLNGSTFDCPVCGSLQVFLDNNGTNKNLHEHLHSLDSRWPADGANTGSISL
jgi:hypothetical protein